MSTNTQLVQFDNYKRPVKQTEEKQPILSPDKVELLKRTVCKGATNDELELFLHVCRRTGLDPFMRQVYAIKRRRKKNGKWSEEMTIQTGIDGFRLIASRTGQYMGSDEPVFEYKDNKPYPHKCKVTVYRYINGNRASFTGLIFWDEFYPGSDKGHFWHKMPHTMLEKCAEAKALRKAFPAELSGVYEHSELTQADSDNNFTALPDTDNASNERNSNGNGSKKLDTVQSYGKTLLNIFLEKGILDRASQRKIIANITGHVKPKYTEEEKYHVIQVIQENPEIINEIHDVPDEE